MSSKLIYLDAGHSYQSCVYEDISEWQINNLICNKVKTLLMGYDCFVIRGDDVTGVEDYSLVKRRASALNAEADMYISVHTSFVLNKNGNYVYVNKHNCTDNDMKLALLLNNKLNNIFESDYELITSDWNIIPDEKVPSVLFEGYSSVEFTSYSDYLREDYISTVADVIASSIIEYFDLVKRPRTGKQKENLISTSSMELSKDMFIVHILADTEALLENTLKPLGLLKSGQSFAGADKISINDKKYIRLASGLIVEHNTQKVSAITIQC